MPSLEQFDHYLADDGPSALVIREYLMPVEGPDGVLFPATFAAGDGFSGGYNIDGEPQGSNVCLVDSVGSQANRIEPLFMREKYSHLVPQIVVQAGDRAVNLLEAGHRAGDALIRCSDLQQLFQDAFRASLRGNAEPLAKIAPTSLVFGVWDSRDTQEKRPRLIASTIRAFDVRRLTRSAVYIPPVDYAELNVFSEEEKRKAEGDTKNPLAKRGFVHVPASAAPGGVIATGGIRRDATLSLAGLRSLAVKEGTAGALSTERTRALRRYILGLALTAFTSNPSGELRQGCHLVQNPGRKKDNEFVEVYPSGERRPVSIDHQVALEYATLVAQAFGVGENRTVPFDPDRARKDVKGEGDTRTKPKKGKSKDQSAGESNAG